MNSRLLIATVGGSPEPLAASVLHWRPARTFFVVSAETKSAVSSQIIPTVQSGGWPDFDAGRYDLVEVPNAQDFTGIVVALRSLDERIVGWLHDHLSSEVITDFTGGTKAMTAGLALAAARWPCQISYVGGTERTKDGVGIVVSGKEQIVHAQNPWEALGYLAAEQAVVLFNHGDYSAAAQLLESTRNRITDGARKRELQAFTALCQLFECWERFQHKDAHSRLNQIQAGRNDLTSMLGQRRAEAVLKWLTDRAEKLKALSAPTADATALLAFVADLLANATRRIREGRHDDAVARLYRAIEALEQAKLHKHGFNDTGNVALDKVPEPLRSQWQSKAQDGQLKLGLQDDYALLTALGDDVGSRFEELKLDGRESLLVARNNSILAHGYAPVSKDTAEKLHTAALKLASITESDLTFFPTLQH